ncbi:MAG: NAD(+)/NADH kinase [Methanocalculus sp. MSAO_Arc1]|uniref:NAD(+)/NADH kinase n=1 Tax=Methanocalculus TaxID=71151 RepID=UPI000FF552C4|nr:MULTISPECIES: NAD(+)/NADH kinase [unclassified Methanocalculus]MCP1662486.1 NAD+ kinase [Methanocalculus sp. AMF5]RQD80828.1 MAG: NAD(+)/NADH kinase [Methanocalculus sp. MSAO_Arc1]
MRFFLFSRIDRAEAVAFAGSLAADLASAGHEVLLEENTAHKLHKDGIGFDDMPGKADIVVAIGGDGTVLRAVSAMKHQVPIIGVNWGEVGFLADLERGHASSFLRSLEPGFPIEKRMRLSFEDETGSIGEALNEALIVTSRPAKMLRFSIVIDDIVAETFRADGVILSTPTGSTAYAMSAGGPIVDPGIDGVLLVPLAPYMLSSRPHIISTERKIEIRLESDKPANLVIDGVEIRRLGLSASIRVRRSEHPAHFITARRTFFEKVEQKLRRL